MDPKLREARLLSVFLEELEEHRESLVRDLLALESAEGGAQKPERVDRMFRAAHSLKGAARSVQAGGIERICHHLEQHFQDLRGQQAAPAPSLIRACLDELDALSREAAKFRDAVSAPAKPAQPVSRSHEIPANDTLRDPRVLRVDAQHVDGLLTGAADLVALSRTLEERLGAFDELRSLARALRAPDRPLAQRDKTLRELDKCLDRTEESLRRSARAVTRATERLEEGAERLRLVPFEEASEGLARAARDLAETLGKPFDLELQCEHVQIDRAIAQRLRDPLLHLLRNAAAHGIETPAERAKAGKPARGKVRLSAFLRGKEVEVQFADDGRGFDLDKLRAQAERMQLPADVSTRELCAYAFLPGFSTSSAVTELSGRGVGLDAVKRAIEAVHGSIELSVEAGRGSTFCLRLPLTFGKLRCVFAMCRERWYAIPAVFVARFARITPEAIVRSEQRLLLKNADGLCTLARLDEVLEYASEVEVPAASGELRGRAIVLHDDERDVALWVDELGAEREVTARALPVRLRGPHPVSSVTSLGSGRIVPILHGQELCRRAKKRLLRATTRPFVAAERRRVLLVEDSQTTRAVLKSLLEEEGYIVTTAQDGEDALRRLLQEPFDLVLSDVEMPYKDGFRLTEEVRAHERLGHLPVVLLTSLANESDRLRGLKAGASAYLVKSAFDRQTLLQTLQTLL